MNLRDIIIISSILFSVILCIGSVSAFEDNATLSVDDADALQIEDNIDSISENESDDGNSSVNESANTNTDNNTGPDESSAPTNATVNATPTATVSKKTLDVFCANAFIQKSNKYFTVKLFKFNEKTNKLDYYKNVKITVKVKIGSKTKTYNVKTNSKGFAKVLNIKNLKVGIYRVTVTSNDERYKINEKGAIGIFNKKQKTVTVKMNARKKIKNDYIEAFYITKNSQLPKGVYVNEYNNKNPLDGVSHTLIMKAKFFFKNKKTGKIISKTVKSKTSKIYGWEYPEYKLIKGYTPIKAKIWYVRC